MIGRLSNKVALVIVAIGIIAIAAGGLFVTLGFQKSAMISDRMTQQAITYAGAGSEIEGVIDNAYEATVMANVLNEHSRELGSYSQLARDDPKRAQILDALTIESSLQMAVMGFGLTDVVKGAGAFMILTGAGFILLGVVGVRSKQPSL